MKMVTMYKRNAKGNIVRWQIHTLVDNSISITHGVFGKKPINEIIKPTLKKVNEIESRVKAKRKEGYKTLEDLYDNAPRRMDDDENLYNYLNTYLPKFNTTSDGFVLPMLAKTLEDNKPFEKFGTMLGQWKINGLRCIVGAEKIEGDIFNKYRLTYTSREGTKWNLSWMDDIIISHIDHPLLEMMLDEDVCLDGELYYPGYTVNDINSLVKNPTMAHHKDLQFWCYDLCMDSTTASLRKGVLNRFTKDFVSFDFPDYKFKTKDEHLNNKEQFIILPTYSVNNITEAITLRDDFISLGFEGLIIRNPDAEYAFGKRNSSMFKFKRKEDGLFTIVDIKEDKRGLPIFTLKNDINDEYFECTINLPQDKQREQLAIKDLLIGKTGVVEYRERSGVKQVPFHAKLIKILL